MVVNEDMSDYVDSFESIFERLDGMEAAVSEDMQVAILLASLTSNKEYDNTVAALKTLSRENLTWDAVTSRLIEEHRAKKSLNEEKAKRRIELENGKLLLSGNKNGSRRFEKRCFICDECHLAHNCKYKDDIKKLISEKKQLERLNERLGLPERAPKLG